MNTARRPGKNAQTAANAPSAATAASLRAENFNLYRLLRLFRRNRPGASAVEFALVAPIFFLFVFGMIEYGRMVMVQQVLTNASREGARRAVLQGAMESDVEDIIRDYLNGAAINGNSTEVKIDIDPAPEDAKPSDESIMVTISVPFRHVSWLPAPFYLGDREMHARSVMRRETLD